MTASKVDSKNHSMPPLQFTTPKCTETTRTSLIALSNHRLVSNYR